MKSLEKMNLSKNEDFDSVLSDKEYKCKKIAKEATSILKKSYHNMRNIEYIGAMQKVKKGEYLFLFNVVLPKWGRVTTIAIDDTDLDKLLNKIKAVMKKI